MGIMFVLIGAAVLVGDSYRPSGMSTYPSTYPYDFGWVWGIFGLIFAFFWVAPWFFGWGWRYRRWSRDWYPEDDAYQILRMRYAKGEITKEQFEQLVADLQRQERH